MDHFVKPLRKAIITVRQRQFKKSRPGKMRAVGMVSVIIIPVKANLLIYRRMKLGMTRDEKQAE